MPGDWARRPGDAPRCASIATAPGVQRLPPSCAEVDGAQGGGGDGWAGGSLASPRSACPPAYRARRAAALTAIAGSATARPASCATCACRSRPSSASSVARGAIACAGSIRRVGRTATSGLPRAISCPWTSRNWGGSDGPDTGSTGIPGPACVRIVREARFHGSVWPPGTRGRARIRGIGALVDDAAARRPREYDPGGR